MGMHNDTSAGDEAGSSPGNSRDQSGWDALLKTQAGIFTFEQALAHGISDHRLRWRVRSGRWQQVHRRVYAAFSGPLSYESRLWAAVLYAGDGAVLCLDTAAYAWGLIDRPPGRIHVLVRRAGRPVSAPGVEVHRTRNLPATDVYRSRAPDRTGMERTILDLAERADREEDVCALVARAVQQRQTSPARLRRALAHRPRVRHRRLIRECIGLAAEGAHSVLEMRHARLGRSHGLPSPSRQVRRARGDRSCYLDAAYEQYGVVVELDGRLVHTSARQWWDDMDRDNQLQAEGLMVLRFPGFLILTDPCRVAADIARALRARGWNGKFRTCPNCARREPEQ